MSCIYCDDKDNCLAHDLGTEHYPMGQINGKCKVNNELHPEDLCEDYQNKNIIEKKNISETD